MSDNCSPHKAGFVYICVLPPHPCWPTACSGPEIIRTTKYSTVSRRRLFEREAIIYAPGGLKRHDACFSAVAGVLLTNPQYQIRTSRVTPPPTGTARDQRPSDLQSPASWSDPCVSIPASAMACLHRNMSATERGAVIDELLERQRKPGLSCQKRRCSVAAVFRSSSITPSYRER